jgi:hypothetical protein
MALNGHPAVSDVSPLSRVKRTCLGLGHRVHVRSLPNCDIKLLQNRALMGLGDSGRPKDKAHSGLRKTVLFDHLVGNRKYARRNRKFEHSRR